MINIRPIETLRISAQPSGEARADEAAADAAAEGATVGVRGRFGGSGAPAWKQAGQDAVGFACEERGGALTGEEFCEVGTDQRRAGARDEESAVVTFDVAQQ